MNFQSIISTKELAKNLDSPNWLILDSRSAFLKYNYDCHQKFKESHIPNAHFLFIEDVFYSDHFLDKNENSLSAYKHLLTELTVNGYNKETQIIIYDDTDNKVSDQVWLFLRSIGLQNVAVLQGGLSTWREQGYPMASLSDFEVGIVSYLQCIPRKVGDVANNLPS